MCPISGVFLMLCAEHRIFLELERLSLVILATPGNPIGDHGSKQLATRRNAAQSHHLRRSGRFLHLSEIDTRPDWSDASLPRRRTHLPGNRFAASAPAVRVVPARRKSQLGGGAGRACGPRFADRDGCQSLFLPLEMKSFAERRCRTAEAFEGLRLYKGAYDDGRQCGRVSFRTGD